LITDDGIIGRSHLPLPTLISWDYSYWDSNYQEDNMSVEVIATTGEGFGALAVLLTIGYPAVQIRQNTAQQKREETVSIQRGQKRSCLTTQWPPDGSTLCNDRWTGPSRRLSWRRSAWRPI